MTSADVKATERFKAGGTLHRDAPSYVTRPADDELFSSCFQRRILLYPDAAPDGQIEPDDPHGRAAAPARLPGGDHRSERLGTQVSREQWYLGIVKRLAQDLRLAVEPEQWWRERGRNHAGAALRSIFCTMWCWRDQQTQLWCLSTRSILTLKLDLRRRLLRRHSVTPITSARSDPAYDRLTFVLLGVVAPTDLIKDRTRTPFNIGHAIDLQEFSRADARP